MENKRKKIVITRTLPDIAKQQLDKHLDCDISIWEEALPANKQQLMELCQNADAILCTLSDKISAEIIAVAPNLKVIANYAAGYNNIDVAKSNEKNIVVTNTPNVLHHTTAELALSLLLSVARKISQSASYAKDGGWQTWEPLGFLGTDLRGKTLGIIGMGQIGYSLAQSAYHGFNMKILYHGPNQKPIADKNLHAQFCDLHTILKESDFISLHCPLNTQTEKIIGKEQLMLMKKDAIIINTARGEVIDQDALIEVMQSGHLAGAGLDVTTPEPLPTDNPLFAMDNVLILPHIGSATVATREKMAKMAADNIIAVLNGKPAPHAVN